MFRKDLITESRHKSALNKKETPLRIFTESNSGIFAGSDGSFYKTTLGDCTCPDFAIQGRLQPCKHMIRLAMELGVIESEGMQSDRDAALVKYHLGSLRDFFKTGQMQQVIPVAQIFLSIVDGSAVSIPDDAFSASMDLASIGDCPLFEVTSDAVRIVKKYEKEIQTPIATLKNRLGEEVFRLIGNEALAKILMEEGR